MSISLETQIGQYLNTTIRSTMENIVRAASRKSQAKDKQSNQSIIVDLFIPVVKMNRIREKIIKIVTITIYYFTNKSKSFSW